MDDKMQTVLIVILAVAQLGVIFCYGRRIGKIEKNDDPA